MLEFKRDSGDTQSVPEIVRFTEKERKSYESFI